ncbi:multicopper oxidase domain-containing protein, partial [Candidatus Azambacteria bacterium]|nr:multicopper oxidase domain-containing protein [Candidatus Azambacteria bacterium]
MKKQIIISIIIAAILVVAAVIFSEKSPDSVKNGRFSSDISGLPEAKQTETVELKNGDTYNITASFVKKMIAGKELRMLAYNGSIPGPVIKAPQGAEITINFTNNTDVKNTIHSHGVRLDNRFDGVPDITQKAVGVGESFTYKIKFPDEGVYWYHPHIREDYAQDLGLYGNYIVTPKEEAYWQPVNREVPIFLDDILIENGKPVPFYKEKKDHVLMGRYGNLMLVNGDDKYRLEAKSGEVVRFYITNSANVRPFSFAISGAKMKLVGGDSGAYEREMFVDSVLLAPSERAVVDVLFERSGSYEMQNKTPDNIYTLGQINISQESASPSFVDAFNALMPHISVVKSIDPFREYFNKEPNKNIRLSLGLSDGMQMGLSRGMGGGHMMPNGAMMGGHMMAEESKDGIEWNDVMKDLNSSSDTVGVKWKMIDEKTSKENMDINWKFKAGDKVKVRIFNDPNSAHPMQHPI